MWVPSKLYYRGKGSRAFGGSFDVSLQLEVSLKSAVCCCNPEPRHASHWKLSPDWRIEFLQEL